MECMVLQNIRTEVVLDSKIKIWHVEMMSPASLIHVCKRVIDSEIYFDII